MAYDSRIAGVLQRLQGARPCVLPSLLACDLANIEAEVRRVEEAGAVALHLDIMDGHFVPNLSYGVPVVQAVRRITDLVLDVHLMLDNPGEYLEPFRNAGADILTVHAEVLPDPRPTLDRIHTLGAAAGISINPPTPLEALAPALDQADLVLVMSVMPGFGGQKFNPIALEKLRKLSERPGRGFLLEVDGGVNDQTIGPCAAAGAELIVAGTAVFGADGHRDAGGGANHPLQMLTARARDALMHSADPSREPRHA